MITNRFPRLSGVKFLKTPIGQKSNFKFPFLEFLTVVKILNGSQKIRKIPKKIKKIIKKFPRSLERAENAKNAWEIYGKSWEISEINFQKNSKKYI